jgi:outer membrane protein assembly factor BamE (lipoprotein component of BamABCDE complex)
MRCVLLACLLVCAGCAGCKKVPPRVAASAENVARAAEVRRAVLGKTQDEVRELLGQSPTVVSDSGGGNVRWHYPGLCLRFDDAGKVDRVDPLP